MSKWMSTLMLSCKKASELIDKSDIQGLSLIERVQLSMHTSMCKGCQAYHHQSHKLNILIGKMGTYHKSPNENAAETVNALKSKILEKIKDE